MSKASHLPLAAVAAAALALAGCAGSKPAPTAAAPAPVASPVAAAPAADPVVKGVGLDLTGMDTSVNPCDDFYHYTSGNWMKNTPIPAAESAWGSFNILAEHNNATLRAILDEAAQQAPTAAKGSNLQKVGDFYAAAMDSAAINTAGLRYLEPHLKRIDAVKNLAEMQRLLADPTVSLGGAWFESGVSPDDKISSQYAVQFYQGGLTLPNRDYYLDDDARSKSIRAAYQTYLVNTFKLLGEFDAAAKAHAAAVMRIETRLAKASKKPVDLRDPYANYNKMTVAQANKAFPNLNLPLMLKTEGLGTAKEVIVGQPAFLKEVSAMLKAEPLLDQKTYLRWHLTSSLMGALPQQFVDESFRFSQTLSGAKKQQPRWKRMLRSTDGALGEAFGQIYVEKAFSPAAKARAKEMIENLRTAYAERINATEWMSAPTKVEAIKKLNAFAVKIGYPDKWKDYSALTISRESYLNDVLAARAWAAKDNLKKFGKPIDRTEWGMTPPTVNAYYNPGMNEIVFPAGILQPPFYDPKADDAVNYGGIGAVIGHEMTHGFDDQGRQYDAQGNLKDWWTKEDGEKFNARAAVVGKQFDAYSPLDSVHVNGKLTMGENLADLGGLTIAYQAFEKTPQAKEQAKLDGFTPEQRFFLSWAQVWRSNMRPEAARMRILTDPHAPNQFRTIGPLQNMPEFYKAFGCQDGAKMMRAQADRAKIW
ncbi:M13 family metallopeptidase [Hymenobacter nivis]|uniref:M13 family peptidase n=1 Tax=Hymenobacter nivis TaxID=1850093 RepID=A0A502HEP6_9BACT|nr:M13 family metallopeptidase [Hymenobacter nivis]TPG72145.1 M13 family peptidase [Hymenobacter nivis]